MVEDGNLITARYPEDAHLFAGRLVSKVNERRDRETKLKLYSRRGALEYWIVNWRTRQIEVYRREETVLKQASIIFENDTLQSPYLPGFRCRAREVFAGIV